MGNPYRSAIGYRGPFEVLFLAQEAVLIRNEAGIVFEKDDWEDLPPTRFSMHPAHERRARRVYDRLEPHGA